MSRFCLAAAAVVLACFLSGCGEGGPTMYPVSGTVTWNGEPIEKGRIVFRDTEGVAVTAGGPITGGEFSFESLPATMRVQIFARRRVPGEFWSPAPGVKIPKTVPYIPARYNKESEMTRDVTEGENVFHFELSGGES